MFWVLKPEQTYKKKLKKEKCFIWSETNCFNLVVSIFNKGKDLSGKQPCILLFPRCSVAQDIRQTRSVIRLESLLCQGGELCCSRCLTSPIPFYVQLFTGQKESEDGSVGCSACLIVSKVVSVSSAEFYSSWLKYTVWVRALVLVLLQKCRHIF